MTGPAKPRHAAYGRPEPHSVSEAQFSAFADAPDATSPAPGLIISHAKMSQVRCCTVAGEGRQSTRPAHKSAEPPGLTVHGACLDPGTWYRPDAGLDLDVTRTIPVHPLGASDRALRPA